MESYNLLHARNEIGHNNQMMLQANGTFSILLIYNSRSELEDFLSFLEVIKYKQNLSINTLFLSNTNAEVVHQHLILNDPAQTSILFLCLKFNDTLDMNELFIGQEVDLRIQNSILTGISDPTLMFDIESNSGQQKWEAWLTGNVASHDIEYYEPGMD